MDSSPSSIVKLSPASNSIQVDRCPECGYSREGLPADRRCPECGAELSADEVVIYGWGKGAFASVSNASLIDVISRFMSPDFEKPLNTSNASSLPAIIGCGLLWFAPQLILLGAHLVGLRLPPWAQPKTLTLLITLGLCATIALLVVRRIRRSALVPAPLQLRLSPKGYSVRLGCGPAAWKAWSAEIKVKFFDPTSGRRRMRIGKPKSLMGANKPVIDIEFRMDLPEANEVVRRVRRFRGGTPTA